MKLHHGLLALTLCAAATGATAQAWPAKPIHIVVAYPAGGSTDLMARLVAQKMAPALGQPIVIENKPGAAGQIGTALVAKSEPDGYTLLFTNAGPGAVAYGLQKTPTYHPVRDFAPVATVANMPLLLAVGGGSRFATVADLVSHARANPGKLNYASTGNGSVSHIATELFNAVAGIKVNHVPYKGGAQTAPAIIGGEVDYFFSVPSDILPHVPARKMKALAFATAKRSPLAPDVPTTAEAGVPNFEVDLWYGLLAPKGTPRAIVERLNREVSAALAQADVSERIAGLASVPIRTTPEEFGALIARDLDKWTQVIRTHNIVAD
jgi:tripartite-type tricarboxylate transporter receptor subunit TctC